VRAKLMVMLLGLSLAAVPVRADGQEGQLVSFQAQDGHGRAFQLERMRGQVVAITFASRYTREEADRVHQQLLGHAAGGDMVVVNVVDLMGVPGIFHGYARRKAAEHDKEGRIVHVIDEQGALRTRFQTDPRQRVDIIVVDREGQLRGHFAGASQVEDALRLVDQLRTSSAQLHAR
jgi:hypothetical protein